MRRYAGFTAAEKTSMNHFLPTTTTSDEKERDAKCAILPVGSFEQHGEYLPLITTR
jgi:creatinine amidohydrolase